MGKRFKNKGYVNARQVPHVIMLAGQHVPGIEVPVEKVLAAEKPALLAIEIIHKNKDVARIHEFLSTQAAVHANSAVPSIAYQARMYMLARASGIPFDFIEKYSDADAARFTAAFDEAEGRLIQVVSYAEKGDLETALQLHENATFGYSRFILDRNPLMVGEIEKLARNTGGKPIAVVVGTSHTATIKALVQRGVKVTLYHSLGNIFSNSQAGMVQVGKATRSERVRLIFQEVLGKYLRGRYGLSDAQMTALTEKLQSFRQLKRTQPAELESFFTQKPGLTQVGFRQHLVEFLQGKGVKLPSREEMEELKPTLRLPEFRKIKTFEPGKHFGVRK